MENRSALVQWFSRSFDFESKSHFGFQGALTSTFIFCPFHFFAMDRSRKWQAIGV
jgi:hypothetical protein